MSQEKNVAAGPRAAPFSISSEDEGGATVITVVGELDMSTAPRLADCLRSAGAKVVVDLGACEFIDSTGIALVVRASRDTDRDGSRIALCCPQQQVLRILHVAGVEGMIPTKPTRQEAIEALGT